MTSEYIILTFNTTTAVIEAESLLKDQFRISIMPLPSALTSGCGLAIRFLDSDAAIIIDCLRTLPIRCRLYRMKTKKTDGKHPIELLYESP